MPVRLESLFTFAQLPVAAVAFERNGMVVAVSDVACEILGARAPDLVGLPLWTVAPELEVAWPALVEEARKSGRVSHELHLNTGEGRRVLAFALAPCELAGQQLVVGFGLDITSWVEAETAANERAKLASKQRSESLGLLAGGVAHDFNNLLVGVLAEASAAREEPALLDPTRDALRRIEAAAQRMAELTRQLLAYAGRGRIVTMMLDPDDLIAETADQLRQLIRRDATLMISPPAQPVTIDADPALLRQVIVNLVANASDALGVDGGSIRIATRVVTRGDASWWRLEVADDGAGIDDATRARMFDPFFSTRPDRRGLGLAAVYGIVGRLGGELEVQSPPGDGARLCVELPILAGAPRPAARAAPRAAPVVGSLAGLRVLIAEDEPSVRASVRRLIERRGASAITASDGTEAIAKLRAQRFDLVLLDVSMPGAGGYEVLPVARETQPGVPVMLMSGYTEDSRPMGAPIGEPDAFVEKPFTAKALDVAIDGVLRDRKR